MSSRNGAPSSNNTSVRVDIPADSKIDEMERPHIIDLSTVPKRMSDRFRDIPILYPAVSYCNYFRRAVQHLILTIIFDWTMFITHPVNCLLNFLFFPLVAIALFFLEIILDIVSLIGWDSSKENLFEIWSKLAPSELELKNNLRSGLESLNDPPLTEYKNKHYKNFNLNRAQILLFLSALLQERDQKLVNEAYKMISDLKNSLKKDKKDENGSDREQIEEIYKKLKESEKDIHKQIEGFGLQFTSLSELNSFGGPYAGMYWNEEENFVVIAFKGTTPKNFNDWLTNSTFQRLDARSYLFGEVHEGYYTQLFPPDEYQSAKVDRRSPATRIIEAARRKAEKIRIQKMEKNKTTHENTPLVNIYVTGHSLGGALATLLFGRLLKSPQSLGKHCILRDGISFACPSIGDNDFSAEFSSLCNRSVEEYKTMWRIVCDDDVVPRVPPGHHHPKIRRYATKVHVMNYFHVGDEIRFYQDGSRPSSMRNIFTVDKEALFIEHGLRWSDWRSLFGFYDPFDYNKPKEKTKFNSKLDAIIYPYERFLIGLFRNHMNHRYFAAMEKSRAIFEKCEHDKDTKVNLISVGENIV